MDERDQVLGLLAAAGVLAGIRWAHRSAYAQVWQDFNPEGGLDQGWIGYTAHKYLINRQDRVFQCEGYAAPPGEEHVGRDVLAAGIAGRDFQTMPVLAPGSVTRQDLHHSPGWLVGEWRWLMVSCEFGQVDRIRWPRKSPTKGEVARQSYLDDEGALFPYADLGMLPPLESLNDPERVLRHTLVLAHAMDPETGVTELYLGRSQWNQDKVDAWTWKEDLLALPDDGDHGRRSDPVGPVGPTGPLGDDVADATVRVRRPGVDADQARAIGEA
jgi:hypothetical protein